MRMILPAARFPTVVSVLVYILFILSAGTIVVHLAGAILTTAHAPVASLLALGDSTTSASRATVPVVTASAVLEGDAWLDGVKAKWQAKGYSGPAARSSLGGGEVAARPSRREREEVPRSKSEITTHRTVCVRLCDGYFFPLSFATNEDQFEKDQETCARSCASPARLYVYQNPGQEPEEMVDLSGKPYAKLSTAFLFRKTFDQSCKCAPHAWEQEAMTRHRKYAEAAEKKKREQKQADAGPTPSKRSKSAAVAEPATQPAAQRPVDGLTSAKAGTVVKRISAAAAGAPNATGGSLAVVRPGISILNAPPVSIASVAGVTDAAVPTPTARAEHSPSLPAAAAGRPLGKAGAAATNEPSRKKAARVAAAPSKGRLAAATTPVRSFPAGEISRLGLQQSRTATAWSASSGSVGWKDRVFDGNR